MADIYKNHKNDLRAYCRCFSEIVERNPSVTAWILLGDAYMSIQEPEKGIAIYERALETNPKAVILAGKIGKALVKTHDFKRALKYYEHAVTSKSAGMNSLRYDLADLYRKLRRYDEGEASILDALESIKGKFCWRREKITMYQIFRLDSLNKLFQIAEDITVRTPQEVNLTLLLARIYRAAGAHEKSVSAFMRSKELQAP